MIMKCDEHNFSFSTDGLTKIVVTRRRLRAYRMIAGANRLVAEKPLYALEKDGAITIATSAAVHGWWEETKSEFMAHSVIRSGVCSNCKERRIVDSYCSNCGADMRKGENDG